MSNRYLLLSLVIQSLFLACHSAKILAVIGMPAYSHNVVFRPLFKELAARGHEVTLITSNPMNEPNSTIKEINWDYTYTLVDKYGFYDYISTGKRNFFQVLYYSRHLLKELMEYEICHPEVVKILKSKEKYDLVFAEYFFTYPAIFGYILNAPSIGVISMDVSYPAHDAVGNPVHPIAYPDYNLPYSTNLSFWERLTSVIFTLLNQAAYKFYMNPMEERIIKRCIGDIPRLETLQRNVDMMFVNANPIFNNIRPWNPTTINYGMFHINQPKPLPDHLQKILDESTNGVIYFSLGSNVKSKHLTSKTKKMLMETLADLPYTILWKFEETLPNKPKNVYIEKWFPQQDILRHPNIKLFITQGGLHSMEEALYYNVPMVCIPFFGDQFHNAHHMEKKGIGLSIDIDGLNKDSFKEAILEVINNPKYKMEAKSLVSAVLDQQWTDLERGVWWTEYVIRHKGAKMLRSPELDLPLYQYYMIDVISFLLLIATMFICAIYFLLKIMIKLPINYYKEIKYRKKKMY